MSRLSRNKIGDDLNPEDWRIHRRWVLGMCGVYGVALLLVVAFSIFSQEKSDGAAQISVRMPTQKRLAGSPATIGSARQSAMNAALDRTERDPFKKQDRRVMNASGGDR